MLLEAAPVVLDAESFGVAIPSAEELQQAEYPQLRDQVDRRVDERRSGETETNLSLLREECCRFCALGFVALQPVAFIEDDRFRVELFELEHSRIRTEGPLFDRLPGEELVVGDDHIDIRQRLGLATADDFSSPSFRPRANLERPVELDGSRTENDRRPSVEGYQGSDRLDRLPEPHIVRNDASLRPGGILDPCSLVWQEGAAQAGDVEI